MIELHDWLKYVSEHRLIFKFKGLRGDRGGKDSFSPSVGKAATKSEQFMNDYMYDLYKGATDDFKAACAAREDHDGILSRFCNYAECTASHIQWRKAGLPSFDCWEDQPGETLIQVVEAFPKLHDRFTEWQAGDASEHWSDIESKDQEEYLLKEHPPEAVWSHAYEEGIDVEDVFFVCPSCHGEPQTEQGLKDMYGEQNGYPRYYCGSCSGEMCIDRHENILDFFNALKVTPYPFNPEKQKHWLGLMAARKEWGLNKLELVRGDLIRLKVPEEREGHFGAGGEKWTLWRDAPGELVRVGGNSEQGIYVVPPDSWEGERGVTFDQIYGREPV